MHLCSRSMMCTKYHSWTGFDKGFSSSRCTQRPRRPPTQLMPNPRDHMINATTHQCSANAFFLLYQHIPGVFNTSCTFLFTHHSFLRVASSSGQLLFHVVYCLYFFFLSCARSSPAVSTITIRLHPFVHFMRYTFTTFFCTHLTLGLPFIPHAPTFGYPGMTDTYDACTPSTPHPFR